MRSAYLVADLEGVSGVSGYDVRSTGSPAVDQRRRRWISLWVEHINAAIRGCLDAGVDRVRVLDYHGPGDSIPLEDLESGADLIHGAGRPTWLPALDRDSCAVLMVGMHAGAGSHGHLCHTYSRTRLREVRLNGYAVGEIGLIVSIAAELGVPCVFVSGDDGATYEARDCVPQIHTATVKRALSVRTCVSTDLARSTRLIRAGVCRALEDPMPAVPVRWLCEPPYHLVVRYRPSHAWRALVRQFLRPRAGFRLTATCGLQTRDESIRHAWDRFLGLPGEV